jgi:drug/metabolite transporter (DMT)-like permease
MAGWIAALGGVRTAVADLRHRWTSYAALGFLNAAAPFTLIAVGELYLPASYSSILNATAPLFGTVLGAAFFAQRIPRIGAVGLGVGLAGVILLVGVAPFALTTPVLLAVVITLLAALSYGAAALYIKHTFTGTTPTQLAFGQLLAAAVLLVPLAAWEAPSAHFTEAALESVLGIVVLSTVLAYTIYFRILLKVGPTEALSVTYLMPIFGVLWGYLLLAEAIGWGIVLGVITILAGVALVTWPRARSAAARPAERSG